MKYKKGYKYQLFEDLELQTNIIPPEDEPIHTYYVFLSDTGLLKIRKGWAWDGASGPTIDTKSSMKGGCGHDGLAYLMRQGKLGPEYKGRVD